jgi:drug/metabolite transporter (DMT)-like permease
MAIIGNTSLTVGIAMVPLVYVKTIMATVPFWASIASYLLIGETIGCFSKVCMLTGFIGVCIIAFSPYVLDESIKEVDAGAAYGIESVAAANLIGCGLILINSLSQGLVTTSTRIM